jgi:hypothetical protein
LETWTAVDDYKQLYRDRVRFWQRDPKLAADAARIAALELEAYVLERQIIVRPKGFVCGQCGIRFFDNEIPNILPLFDGTGEPVWFHANCALRELYERKASAQTFLKHVL